MGRTAADVIAELEEKYRSDPIYRAGVDARKRQQALRSAEITQKRAALRESLRAAGVTATYDRLTGKKFIDPRIVEVAFDHLVIKRYDQCTRGWIASHLATRAAEPYWDRILAMLGLAPSGTDEAFQLACSLAVCARAKKVDEMMAFVLDPTLGQCRSAFLRPINRLGRARGKAFVAQFVADPDLG